MRITFILTSFPRLPIGGHRVVYEYANHLVARGHQVSIVHCRSVKGFPPPSGWYKYLRTHIGYVYRSLLRPRPKWQHVDSRVKMMFAPEPLERYVPDGDVVFATAWALSDYVLGYSANKGKKCYLYQHYETWSGPRDKVDATWRAPFHKVVISKWLYEIGVALGATTMAYIPNGIDHDLFETYVPIRSRRRIVAMMFSQQAWKGSEDGLRALSIVKDRVPELRAILFGVRRPGFALPDWVEFHENPSQEDLVKRIYNASSCFLCPSHFEGFSLPAAEAMACGCAVVCTDCGGIRDFAEDGVSALISAPNDPEALAKNLFRVLQDDDLRVGLAEMGRRSIQQFTWERSTELMEAFLVGCINFTVV